MGFDTVDLHYPTSMGEAPLESRAVYPNATGEGDAAAAGRYTTESTPAGSSMCEVIAINQGLTLVHF